MKTLIRTFISILLMNLVACTPKLDIDMVAIPGGTFEMGSNSGDADEKPLHKVTIKDFYMSSIEITVGQWRNFVDETGYKSEAEIGDDGAHVWNGEKYEKKKGVNWKNPGFVQSDKHPVTCISWNDSQAFINWLNRKMSKNYRLPTEAEWEYCCKAGTSGNCYGNIDSIAWYKMNSDQLTHPVGQKKNNSYKLYDMLGNVWEWCQDWDGAYIDTLQLNPVGPADGTLRIARGAGWLSKPDFVRSSDRASAPPNLRSVDLGFRLALD